MILKCLKISMNHHSKSLSEEYTAVVYDICYIILKKIMNHSNNEAGHYQEKIHTVGCGRLDRITSLHVGQYIQ